MPAADFSARARPAVRGGHGTYTYSASEAFVRDANGKSALDYANDGIRPRKKKGDLSDGDAHQLLAGLRSALGLDELGRTATGLSGKGSGKVRSGKMS